MSINPIPTPHCWSKGALFAKAQRYIEEMLSYSHDDWKFVFWSTLALELLARATLANVNRALLADLNNWNNLYYALGFNPTINKFKPRSIDITTVFNRLHDIVPDFTKELVEFSILHMHRRNEELHSGNTPLDGISSSKWLPIYYQTCKILLKSMDHNLVILLGDDEAKVAEDLITADQDETAKSVMKSINDHETDWNKKGLEEKKNLLSKATAWAASYKGHRVNCPSCKAEALIFGEAITAPKINIKNDEIIETQEYLPSKFECVACGLKIAGLSHLSACELSNPFKATFTYNAAEYFQPTDEYSDYEPDYNEP